MTDAQLGGRRLRWGLAMLAIVIVGLASITVFLLLLQASAVDALKTSSARGECARAKTNQNTDDSHRDLAAVLDDVVNRRPDLLKIDVERMRNRPDLQKVIDADCPAPLVKPPNTSSTSSTTTKGQP